MNNLGNVDDYSWRPIVGEPRGESILVECESRVGIVHLGKIFDDSTVVAIFL